MGTRPDPRAWSVDAVVAVALTVASQVEIWAPGVMPGVSEDVDSPLLMSVTTVAMTLPLALRRTRPLLVLLLGLAAASLQQVLATPNEGLTTLVSLLVACYSAAAYSRALYAAASGVAILAASIVIGLDAADRVFIAIVLGAAWLSGFVVAERSGQVARLTGDNRDLADRLTVAATLLRDAEARLSEVAGAREAGAPTPAPDGLAALTARELDVVRAVARGMSNAEIAAHLVISEWTVKTHVASVLRKLGVRDRAQVVVAAYESRLVEPGTG